nr:efflux RND transporter permease subunit [uncultured Solibaculum sp.]
MLSKFSVKKPFTVVVGIIIVLILGFVSYSKMTIDLLPSMNMPYALVTTAYAGASPEEVETAVTQPLEQAMASVGNVKNVRSVSSENSSMVILEFSQDANMDTALIEMRESLDLVSSYLPNGVGSPIIMKMNPDMMPVMAVSASVEGEDISHSSQTIEEKIVPELESVNGVASVSAEGALENMVQVTINSQKVDKVNEDIREAVEAAQQKAMEEAMAQQGMGGMTLPSGGQEAMGEGAASGGQDAGSGSIPQVDITADMLDGILQGQNFSMPTGNVEQDGVSYLVRTGDKIAGLEELKNLVVMDLSIDGMEPIRLSDVADIVTTDNSADLFTKVNGQDAIVLMMQKQPEYSTAEVAQNIRDQMETLQQEHEGLQMTTLMDQGIYVNMMIDTILQNLIIGGLLAILILLLFLKSIKPTFIVGLSIVISVIGAFVLMYFSGVTLNIISMGGLALGVGMLVDNSIVVIENIYRMRADGKGAKEAAIDGAKQVAGAITASTITTIAVFLPIVFTEGLTRQIFTDMGLTIAFSLLASLVVALTLVPMASSVMLKKQVEKKHGLFDKMVGAYEKSLRFSLAHRWMVIVLVLALFGGSIAAAFNMGTELFPATDTGEISVSAGIPDDMDNDQIHQSLDDLSNTLAGIPEVETVGVLYASQSDGTSILSMMGGGGATLYVQLKEDRDRTTGQVTQEIRDKTAGSPLEIEVSGESMDMSAMAGGGLSVDVYANDMDALRQSAREVAGLLGEVEGVVEIDDGLGKTSPEKRIVVDKEKSMSHGLTVAQVYSAVSEYVSSTRSATTVADNGIDYGVYVEDDRYTKLTADQLGDISIETPAGESITVADVAEIVDAEGPSSIRHDNQERTVGVTASLAEGYNVGKVNQQVEEKLNEHSFPQGVRVDLAGQNEMMQSTFKDLFLMMILAVVFIYLIMVAQFQSLLSPFIVMFTIPLGFTGGIAALLIAGMPISVVAFVGIIMLAGIVVNNGIVFVDYVNRLRADGMEKREALVITGRHRIRPILMTALTTIIALLTTCLDSSANASMMKPMAVTVVGGLVYATLLTLYFVPVLYDLFVRKRMKKEEKEG